MNHWDEFGIFLKEIFQSINEGNSLLTPNEFWQQYGSQISQINDEQVLDKLIELGDRVWLPKPYETVRLLSNLRQRSWVNGIPTDGDDRQLVENVRVEIELRKRPNWDKEKGNLDGDLRTLAEIGGKPKYSEFQVLGWKQTASALQNRAGLVIVAPTGAGKTEVFMLPLITSIASKLKNDPLNVPHYVFIYPRITLLEDQLSRILKYVFQASKYYHDKKHLFENDNNYDFGAKSIIVGLQYGEIRAKTSGTDGTFANPKVFEDDTFKVVPACPICEKGQLNKESRKVKGVVVLRCSACKAPFHLTLARNDIEVAKPHILVTTIESLAKLFLNPKFDKGDYLGNLDTLVFDEVHLYSSLYGAHVSNIVRRIENSQIQNGQNRKLTKIASSATVSNPQKFVAKLLYGDENQHVELHDASFYRNECDGLETVIFLRAPSDENAPSPQSTLIQAAMAMGHGVLGPGDRSIVFTDSVDHVSRTYGELDNAEREQRLWEFRTLANQIQYHKILCPGPKKNAFQCSIYQDGKCWRGLRGGKLCVICDDIRVNSMDVRKISSRDSSEVRKGDIVIATASLEVGVDDPNFRATIHYRPPLNVFSFIQRRGRAGRKRNVDDAPLAYTIMILGNDAVDEFYFRRRHRLLDGSRYELPLNPQNVTVSRIHEHLEFERATIDGMYKKIPHLPKAILIWLLEKYIQCNTLSNLFGEELRRMLTAVEQSDHREVGRQQDQFKVWVRKSLEQFQQYLELEVVLQELEARIPLTHKANVIRLKGMIQEYNQFGDISQESQIKQLARDISKQLTDLRYDANNNEEREEIDWLRSEIEKLESNYRLPEKFNIGSKEVSALYQFFVMLQDKFTSEYSEWTLSYAPDAIPLVLQTLFYINSICVENCPSCGRIDFFVPDSYFQEVKPIFVQTLTSSKRQENQKVEAEDSTKLATLLTPYKPFYRYFNDQQAMAILVTEHDPTFKTDLDSGEQQVGLRLIARGLVKNGSLEPRRIFVKPLKPDKHGQNVVKLCENCYRLHDENYEHKCTCGSRPIPVKLFPKPKISRSAENVQNPIQISDTFFFSYELIGSTIIEGAQVEYRRMFQKNGEYWADKKENRKKFNAVYLDKTGSIPEPLRYSIRTHGIIWDLKNVVKSLMQDNDLAYHLSLFEKKLSEELILHTAAHMLYKAFASLAGVSEQVLEYAYDISSCNVVIWERYEGGVGLSEILRDILRENPKKLYQELLFSVLCPVHYSQSLSNSYDGGNLRTKQANQWALAEEDELLDIFISEARAEYQASKEKRAESSENGCLDGCPACVYISLCTAKGEQQREVSRLVAEKIMRNFYKRVTHEQWVSMNAIRSANKLMDVLLLNDKQETIDVVCF